MIHDRETVMSYAADCRAFKAQKAAGQYGWFPYVEGANLRGADLSGADLSGVVLTIAGMTGTDLRGADLRGANLTGSTLVDADLRGADLRGAKLGDVAFHGARLEGARIEEGIVRAMVAGYGRYYCVWHAFVVEGGSLILQYRRDRATLDVWRTREEGEWSEAVAIAAEFLASSANDV
jgi:uncharacterized protein YjbI with pentapeptide repeats